MAGSEGLFPRPPATLVFVLGGAGAVGTDADAVGAALLELAALAFTTGFYPLAFGGVIHHLMQIIHRDVIFWAVFFIYCWSYFSAPMRCKL
jgi:hypothetical protein